MNITHSELPGLILFDPRVFTDTRGYFLETWRQNSYAEAGIPKPFVQENLSHSKRGVLRGLHFQNPNGQGKLVQVLEGEVFDVAVDIRVGSPTFKRSFGVVLSSTNHRQMYIPEGFAHGFCVLSETALFSYKVTAYHSSKDEKSLLWNDPELAIEWPLLEPVLSDKDRLGPPLSHFAPVELPHF